MENITIKMGVAALVLLLMCQMGQAPLGVKPNTQQLLIPKDTGYPDINGKAYPFVGKIPRELRSQQQQAYVKKLYHVLLKYYVLEYNKQVFKLGEREFVSMGLSRYDYQLALKGPADSNQFYAVNGSKGLEEMNLEWKAHVEDWLND